MNNEKIILDLCGGTGSFSAPYKKAGYNVQLITLPDNDILTYEPPKNAYGVLAAPPCTDFSLAGANLWKKKDLDGRTEKSLQIVQRCLEIIELCQPVFWALENPKGRLYKFIGRPANVFNFADFGCHYSKWVYLWGKYNFPFAKYYNPSPRRFDTLRSADYYSIPDGYNIKGSGMSRRQVARSITCPEFAEAFFLANQ